MSSAAALQAQAAKPASASPSNSAGLLQRQCACEPPDRERDESRRKAPLQPQLSLGSSEDPLEREADRVAEQVLGVPSRPAVGRTLPQIQRYAAHQPAAARGAAVPASVGRVLAEPGRPLEPALRQDMELRFGHDFSRVRVHCGAAAAESARSLASNAYTVGHDIAFAAGRFAPATPAGRRLLAHELTHVVQQTQPGRIDGGKRNGVGGPPSISRSGPVVARDLDAGVPAGTGTPVGAGPAAGAPGAGPAVASPGGAGPVPAAPAAGPPAAAAPVAVIGAVSFRGSTHRIAPTRTASVPVTISGLAAGATAAIDVEGSGGANGTASVTAGASLTGSGTVAVRGGTQTSPGNAGSLRLRATIGGTVAGRSPGFTVAAWPADFTISRHSDIGSGGAVGLRVNIACVSDGSGALAELSEAEHTERVDIGSRDNPPFTVPGAISATGTGTSGFMAATSTSLVDSHAYASASIDTTAVAAGVFTLVYRQNFLFNDRRTGVTNRVVQNSGFTITHLVTVLDLPIVGRTSAHIAAKRGAAVTVEGRPASAGSGTATGDTHVL